MDATLVLIDSDAELARARVNNAPSTLTGR